MTDWKPGQHVRFFSREKMDYVRGVIVSIREGSVVIKWNDEDCRRVYEAQALIDFSGRGQVDGPPEGGVHAIDAEEEK